MDLRSIQGSSKDKNSQSCKSSKTEIRITNLWGAQTMLSSHALQLNYILLAPSMAHEILFMYCKGKDGIWNRLYVLEGKGPDSGGPTKLVHSLQGHKLQAERLNLACIHNTGIISGVTNHLCFGDNCNPIKCWGSRRARAGGHLWAWSVSWSHAASSWA